MTRIIKNKKPSSSLSRIRYPTFFTIAPNIKYHCKYPLGNKIRWVKSTRLIYSFKSANKSAIQGMVNWVP